jgi:hypothetical protein
MPRSPSCPTQWDRVEVRDGVRTAVEAIGDEARDGAAPWFLPRTLKYVCAGATSNS